jgi:hypothetical protein
VAIHIVILIAKDNEILNKKSEWNRNEDIRYSEQVLSQRDIVVLPRVIISIVH